MPHGDSYAYALSNQAYGYLRSDPIPVTAGVQYDLYAYVRGELDAEDSHGGWIVRALFYDSSGAYLSYQDAASGGPGSLTTTWQNQGGRVTAPASAATMRIDLYNYMNSGWAAYDDVTLPVQVSVTKYYYIGGQRVAMRQGSTLYFLHSDHLGSTSLLTRALSESPRACDRSKIRITATVCSSPRWLDTIHRGSSVTPFHPHQTPPLVHPQQLWHNKPASLPATPSHCWR